MVRHIQLNICFNFYCFTTRLIENSILLILTWMIVTLWQWESLVWMRFHCILCFCISLSLAAGCSKTCRIAIYLYILYIMFIIMHLFSIKFWRFIIVVSVIVFVSELSVTPSESKPNFCIVENLWAQYLIIMNR